MNDDGKITFAADKRYASVVKTRDDYLLLEEYFDEDGNPSKQASGYYALIREYNDAGQEYKVTYLDIDKQPVMNNLGYASVVHTYNVEGKVETNRYYDTELKPVKSKHDGYGSYKGYDINGRNNLIIHLDEKDAPMIAGNGYAVMNRFFYEDGPNAGRVKEEYYFDTNNNPIALSMGQYGLQKNYDEYGRTNVLTYINADGKPSPTKKGYTTIKRTFYEDDSIKTELYYDIDGKPFRMANGQYGILNQYGETIYLDSKGDPFFDLKNHLVNNQMTIVLIVLIISIISSCCGYKANVVLLIIYIAGALYMTLGQRNDVKGGLNMIPLWSYKQFFSNDELRWEIVNNILLFVPLGILLYQLYPRIIILFVPILLSVVIEGIQYLFGLGLCELDDVISNGLGGIIGFVAGGLTTGIKSRIKKRK